MVDLTGQVAIVTGGGRGLGREHALLMARRGARVVINDLGGSVSGDGHSPGAAHAVVREINEAGGEAIASGASVIDAPAIDAMVQDTIARWGRVDILINNAGILRDRSFAEMELADFREVVEIHLMGSVICTKAVWQHMIAQRYGRIVMTTSASGLYGNFGQTNYGAAKMALVGLMQTLGIEGEPHGVRVNALAPVAGTRMLQGLPGEIVRGLDPAAVSPGLLALVGRDAPNRMILCAGSGSFEQAQITLTRGIKLDASEDLDDHVLAAMPAIGDRDGDIVPADASVQLTHEMAKAGYDMSGFRNN